MEKPVMLVTRGGERYRPEGQQEVKRESTDEFSKKSLKNIKEEYKKKIETNLWDEVVFYSQKYNKVIVTQFRDIPEGMKAFFKNGGEVKIEGEPSYKQIIVDDEPGKYEVIDVTVEGLGPENDEMMRKIRDKFTMKEQNRVCTPRSHQCFYLKTKMGIEDLDDAIKETREEFPVEVRATSLKKVAKGKVTMVVNVSLRPKGVLIEGLDKDDPVRKKIEAAFKDKYLGSSMAPYGLDFKTSDGILLRGYIQETLVKADDYYGVKAYIRKDKDGKLVFRIRKYENVKPVVYGNEDQDVVNQFFEDPKTGKWTKRSIIEGVKRTREFFAKKGKTVIFEAIEPKAISESGAYVNINYQTVRMQKKIIVTGDLPIGRDEIEKMFGMSSNAAGYSHQEVVLGVEKLKRYLSEKGYISVNEARKILKLKAEREFKIVESHPETRDAEKYAKGVIKRGRRTDEFIFKKIRENFLNGIVDSEELAKIMAAQGEVKGLYAGYPKTAALIELMKGSYGVVVSLSAVRIKKYNIQLTGAGKIDPSVAKDCLKDKPGDFFNAKEFVEALNRVMKTGQFTKVDHSFRVLRGGGEIVPVIFAEPNSKTSYASLGVGFGENYISVQAGYGTRRHDNKEMALGVQATLGTQQKGGQVSLADPNFFGRGWSFNSSLYGNYWTFKSLSPDGKIGEENSWHVGASGMVGIPIAGPFSPWKLFTGLDVSYIYYDGNRPAGMGDTPVLVAPGITVGYFGLRREASLTARGSLGAMNYPEFQARFMESIPLSKRFSLELSAAGGLKLASNDLPAFAQFNIFNTPFLYGQNLSDLNTGLSFVNLSAKLAFVVNQYLVLKSGVTAGGIGNSYEDMQKVGAGLEANIPILGLTLAFGYLYDIARASGKFGFTLRFGGRI